MRRYELSLNWYLEKTMDLLEMCPLEDQFQDFIVYPILEEVIHSADLCDCDLVDCHNFKQFNTQKHDRTKYSVLAKAVPDLLIARNFFYNNADRRVYDALEPIAAIEVKEPNGDTMIDKVVDKGIYPGNKEIIAKANCEGATCAEYGDYLCAEILPNLVRNGKLVLTNIRKWEVFDVRNVNKKGNEYLIENIHRYMSELDEIGRRYNKNSERKQMLSGAKELDREYSDSIKEYVKKAHVKTWDIITTKGRINVNRCCFIDNKDSDITEMSDISYNRKEWDGLVNGLRRFLFS